MLRLQQKSGPEWSKQNPRGNQLTARTIGQKAKKKIDNIDFPDIFYAWIYTLFKNKILHFRANCTVIEKVAQKEEEEKER